MAKMKEPKTMRKASSRSCFFVVGAVGIVYEVDVSLTKIIPLVDSTASRREIRQDERLPLGSCCGSIHLC